MNAPIVLAQLSAPTAVTADAPKSLKLGKPTGGQAVTVRLDGATRLDFTDLGNEKLTFVRIGSRLIILFDNQSTVTVEPVFDRSGKPFADIGFAMGPDRTLNGEEFASLFPISTDQSILPAAGTPGAPSIPAGANFGSATIDALSGGNPLDLLGNELGDLGVNATDLAGQNTTPIAEGADAALVNEDGLPEGNPFGDGDEGGSVTSLTGSLNVNFGIDAAGRSFSFPISQPGLAGLTSGGQPVQLLITTVNGQPTLIGYVGGDALDPAGQVFTISLDALSTIAGTYTFTLLRPLDHSIAGTEDTLTLTISVTATDGSGDAIPTSISIGINDDTPVLLSGPSFRVGAVDDEGAADAATTVASGSLGISFGSDNGNSSVDGGQSGGAANGDRAVTFAPDLVAPAGLSSGGDAVQYVVLGNGTVLVAYTGSVVPSDATITAGDTVVFFVRLSDQGQGGFEFTLVRPLDHSVAGVEDDISLSFGFVATDGDGDPVSGSFAITINDDMPTAGTQAAAALDDDALTGGNNGGVGDADGVATTSGTLIHDYKADGAGTVLLTGAGLPADSSTEGAFIETLSGDGQTLTISQIQDGLTVAVITVQLADASSGDYSITLTNPIRHAAGADENDTAFTIGYQVTDFDGDTAIGTLDLSINDDTPVVTGTDVTATADEDDIVTPISLGSLPDDGNGDGSFTGDPSTAGGPASVTGSIASVVSFGADGQGVSGGFSFTSTAAATLAGLGLESKGADLRYVVSGNTLTAYVDVGTENNGYGESDRTVFTLSIDPATGDYTFNLYDQLDHVAGNGQDPTLVSTVAGLAAIDFGAVLQASDADGDVVALTGTLKIAVTDDIPAPVIVTTGASTTIDETAGIQNNDTTLDDVAGLFAAVGNPGIDTDLGGPLYARNPSALVSTTQSASGADESASQTLSLRIEGANGTPTGLSTTDGQPISLYAISSTLIVGRVGGEAGAAAFAITIDQSGRVSIAQYLSLAHGNTASADEAINLGNLISAVVTATDFDGDTVLASTFIGGQIRFEDDGPRVGGNGTVWLDDDNLSGGNPGGTGDNPLATPVNASGTLNHDFGADGGSIAWLTTGAPGGFSYVADGSNLLVKQGSVTVMTVTLDPATGAYTVTQNAPVMHAPGDNENNQSFDLAYRVTDGDGDSVVGSLSINVDDDTPVVTGAAVAATVDEDDILNLLSQGNSPNDGTADGSTSDYALLGLGLAATATGSVASVVSFGADGQAAGGGFGFSADAIATMTALGLTSKGGALSYAIVGDAILAYVDNGNGSYNVLTDRPVFSLQLNDSTGAYSFRLYDQLDHVAGDGQNTALRTSGGSISGIDFGAIIEATDRDGDTVGLDGKLVVTITDDIPEVAIWTDQTVTVDETAGNQNDDTSNNAVRNLFDSVDNRGTDPDLLPTYARDDVVDTAVNGGADDNVSTSLTLRIDGGDGTNSGLTTTDGAPIVLFLENGVVVGRIGGDIGLAVFAVAIQSNGQVSVAQFIALNHPNTGSHDDSINLAGKISAVLTATDHDGDVVSQSVGIGDRISFEDDGPRVGTNVLVQVDEDTLPGGLAGGNGDDVDAVALTGTLAHFDGADGTASVLWSTAGVTLPSGFWFEVSADGTVMTITQNQGNGYVPVLTMTITNTASGAYSVAQVAPIDHPQGTNPGTEDNVQFTVSYVVTDGDGDTAIGTISVNVDDDTPTVGANALIQLDDDALAGGNAGGIGDEVETAVLSGVLSHSGGADGTASVLWAPNGLTLPNGFWFELSADSRTMTITQEQNGVDVGVFQATITDPATGAYQVTQLAPVKHNTSGTEDNAQISFQYRVTDGDGDVATGTLTVNIDDDTPTVGANALIQLDDDALAGGNAGGIGDEIETAVLSGVLSHSGGADGTTSVLWAPNGLALQNGFWFELSADSRTMTITQLQNGVYVGVFKATITDPATGAYQVTQLAPVDHNTPGTEDNAQISFQYRVTDGDGDIATGTLTVNVDDDTPTASPSTTVWLDDEDLSGGNPGGIDDQTGTPTNRTGMLNHSFGADSDGASMSWLATSSSNADSLGFTYEVTNGGNTLLVKQGGTLVFTATMNQSTGAYTITQNAAIDHPAGGDENDVVFQLKYLVTDGDGDTAESYLWVKVDDDTPTGGAGTTAWLDDDSLTGGNPGGVGDNALANTSNVLKHSFGADGAGGIAWTGITVSSGGNQADFSSTVLNDGRTLQVYQNGTLVITATLNPLTGQYSLVHNAPIDHVAGGDENQIQFKFLYNVTDGDGDAAAGYIWVNVDDDTPTGGAGTTAWLDDDSLTGGNPDGVGDNPLANTSNVLKHSFGADGAGGIAWTGITVSSGGNQADFSSTVSNDGKTLQVYQNGTLVITATLNPLTGQYSLVHNAPIDHVAGGDENEIQFKFLYNVTDGDGDAAAGYIWVNVDDDTPTGGAGTTAWLDDDSLAGGNPDGVGDNPLANTSNVLKHSFGADGAGGIAWTGITVSSGGNQADFSSTVSNDGKTLQVYQNGTLIITATLNPLTGQYSLVHNAPIDHVAGGDENQIQFKFLYDVTDGDGDAAAGYIWVNVDDDTPTIPATATQRAGVDDDALPAGNTESDDTLTATGTLSYSFGADGGSLSWQPSTLPSGGFTSTITGNTFEVFQSQNGVAVKVFEVELDPATGAYTVTQFATVRHPTGNGEQGEGFNLNYRVTDGDGDYVDGFLRVVVGDDVPVLTQTYRYNDVFESGIAAPTGTDNSNFAISYGADGYGATAFTGAIKLDIGPGLAGNVSFNLANGDYRSTQFTSDGRAITFTKVDDNTIRGFVASADNNNGSDETIFEIELTGPSGAKTTLYGNLDHLAAGNGSAIDSLVVDATVRFTDGDGDSVTGVIRSSIKDDAPTVGAAVTLSSLNEDDLSAGNDESAPKESLVATAPLAVSWGADSDLRGPGDAFGRSIAFDATTLPSGLTSGGVAVVYGTPVTDAFGGVTLTAYRGTVGAGNEVFTVKLDANTATGTATFTLQGVLDHPGAGETPLNLAFGYKATDADGDQTSAGTFSIDIVDDVPTIPATTTQRTGVQDDALPGGNPESDDTLTATGTLSHSFGADGGSLSWRPSTLPGGGYTSTITGNTFEVFQLQNGAPVKVFEVVLDPATGGYTVTQFAAVKHPVGNGEQGEGFNLNYRVTDGDGDYVESYLRVVVGDDVPVVGGPVTLASLNEDDLSAGNDETAPKESLVATAALAVSWGADSDLRGPGDAFGRSIAFDATTLPSGLTSGGVAVVYGTPVTDAFGGVTLTAYRGTVGAGNEVFTVKLDATTATGTATFTLQGVLDHSGAGETPLNLAFGYKATDADGDQTSAGTFSIDIVDDVPVLTQTYRYNDVFESGIGLPAETDSSNFAISYGADGYGATAFTGVIKLDIGGGLAGNVSFNLANGDYRSTQFTSDGRAITFTKVDDDTIRGFVASADNGGNSDETIFEIELTGPSGAKTTLYGNLDHFAAEDGSAIGSLVVDATVRFTDGDGDSVTGIIRSSIKDDAPVSTGAVTAATVLDDDAQPLFAGNDTPADGVANVTSASGSAGALFAIGADGLKTVTLGATTPFSAIYKDGNGVAQQESVTWGTPAVVGGATTWTATGSVSNAVVATLTINADGSYSFSALKPLVHPTPGTTEENLALTFAYTVTDGDNDSATGSLTVNVNDDAPRLAQTLRYNDVFESGVGAATGTESSNFAISYGADGYGSTAFTGAVKLDLGPGLAGNVSFDIANVDYRSTQFTSDGRAITFTKVGDNMIRGFVASADNGNGGDETIFEIELTGPSGAKTTLSGNLDHIAAGNGSAIDSLVVDATVRFTDGDGDSVTGIIRSSIKDDAPALATIADQTATELTASGGSNAFQTQTLTNVALNVGWGSDDANPTAGAGAHDRGVAFAASLADAVPSGVTSNGFDLIYRLSADGQSLTAYRYENGHYLNGAGGDLGTSPSNSARVFAVSLADGGSGSYSFTLYDNLDHASGNAANSLPLSFGFTATDSDGDAVAGSFTVQVTDDLPLAAGSVEVGSIAEGNLDVVNPSTFGYLAIDWNADDRNVHLTFTSTTITDGSGNALALTSGGVALKYVIVAADGSTNPLDQKLIAYKDGDTPDNPVFAANLVSAGSSYQFVLFQPLDHDGVHGGTLPLTFDVTGYDGDGDPITQSFTVNVADGTPLATADTASGDEDTAIQGSLVDNVEGGVDGLAATPYAIATGPENGVLTLNLINGAYTYTPNANFNGTDSFTYTVADSDGDISTPATVTITVASVNDTPVITSAATGSESENLAIDSVVYQITATDVDPGSTLTYSISGADSAAFNVNTSTGAVTFKASPNYEAPTDGGANNVYDIVVHANDGIVDATKAVAITVNNVAEGVVGYFTTNANYAPGMADAIARAGGVPVRVTTISDATLAGLDVFVYDAYGSSSTSYVAARTTILNHVVQGMDLFINDGSNQWSTYLPGFAASPASSYTSNDVNLTEASPFVNGVGGVLTDSSLDGGSSSIHGAILSSSLPAGVTTHLTSASDAAVTGLSLSDGAGTIVYTTMPLTFYFQNYDSYYSSTPNHMSAGMSNYFTNVVEELVGTSNSGPDYNIVGTSNHPDYLTGGAGNDTIKGLAGKDIVSGGAGADTFVYAETGASNLDTILDYSSADVIDLSALLGPASGAAADGSNITDYVKLTQAGADILVQVDVDGTAGGSSFADVALLYGYGTSNADLVRIAFQGQEQPLQV